MTDLFGLGCYRVKASGAAEASSVHSNRPALNRSQNRKVHQFGQSGPTTVDNAKDQLAALGPIQVGCAGIL